MKRNVGRTVKCREQQPKNSLLDCETLQKTKSFGEQTAAARNDVIAKKLLVDCFKTSSGWPEDWTVSGPCHLYPQHIFPSGSVTPEVVGLMSGQLIVSGRPKIDT